MVMLVSIAQVMVGLLVPMALSQTPLPGNGTAQYNVTLIVDRQDVDLILGETTTLNISLDDPEFTCTNLTAMVLQDPKVVVEPIPSWDLCMEPAKQLQLNTSHIGKTNLVVQVTPLYVVDDMNAYARVSVMKNPTINVVADVLGWIYTIAWDISFLPQIMHNWKRKSVVGLSFDFLTFNFLGFFSYFLFNMGLLWIPQIQAEYAERYPHGVMHVRINDVIFPLYALVCTVFQIGQCLIYEKSLGQRVSTTCRIISSLLLLSEVIYLIVTPLVESVLWLDFLYYLSYIKLTITCIKYTPQLWTNYQRRSTDGWSIWQVILDFTGGTMSLLQMFLLAANYDDWYSVLTDPAKLGLGLLSIFFNILFFIQHYCLYKTPSDKSVSEEKVFKDGEIESVQPYPTKGQQNLSLN